MFGGEFSNNSETHVTIAAYTVVICGKKERRMKKTAYLMFCLLLVGIAFAMTSCLDICDHVYEEIEEERVHPTCTADGTYMFACTLCGRRKTVKPGLMDAAMLATGHAYAEVEEERVLPTCTSDGMYVYVCTSCGDRITLEPDMSDTAMKAQGHDTDEGCVTVPVSCLTDGTVVYACRTCREILEIVTIPATGHRYDPSQWHSGGGEHRHVCDLCEQPVDRGTCEYVTVPYDKTCHTVACRICLAEQPDARSVHQMDGGVITAEPTCFSLGCKTYTCTLCGYSEQESLPTVDHDYDRMPLAFDGTAHWEACRFCEKVNDGTVQSHVYGDAAETPPAPTSCAPGTIAEACTVCSYVKIAEIPSTLPHALTTALSDGDLTVTCRDCHFSWTSVLTSVSDGTNADALRGAPDTDAGWGGGASHPNMVEGYYKYERNDHEPTVPYQAQFYAQLPAVSGEEDLPAQWTGAHISLKLKQGEAYMENWQILLVNTDIQGDGGIQILSSEYASFGSQKRNICDASGGVLSSFSVGSDWIQMDMELTFDKDADTMTIVYYVNGKYRSKVQLNNVLGHDVFNAIYFTSPAGSSNVYTAAADHQPCLYFDDIILAIRGKE